MRNTSDANASSTTYFCVLAMKQTFEGFRIRDITATAFVYKGAGVREEWVALFNLYFT